MHIASLARPATSSYVIRRLRPLYGLLWLLGACGDNAAGADAAADNADAPRSVATDVQQPGGPGCANATVPPPGAPSAGGWAAGSRLSVAYTRGEDGARVANGFFDTKTQSICVVTRATDGNLRCLPRNTDDLVVDSNVFVDANCTIAMVRTYTKPATDLYFSLVNLSSIPPHQNTLFPDATYLHPKALTYSAFQLGREVQSGDLFSLNGFHAAAGADPNIACQPVDANYKSPAYATGAWYYYSAGLPLPPSDFVMFQSQP